MGRMARGLVSFLLPEEASSHRLRLSSVRSSVAPVSQRRARSTWTTAGKSRKPAGKEMGMTDYFWPGGPLSFPPPSRLRRVARAFRLSKSQAPPTPHPVGPETFDRPQLAVKRKVMARQMGEACNERDYVFAETKQEV